MKKNILTLMLFIFNIIVAQKEMITNIGALNFEASVPLFEEIKATNKNVECILNQKTGEIISSAFIKDFHFKTLLMEEHFNKNYLESERYPKAIFKGKIQDFNLADIESSPKKFTLKGKLEIHGKKKAINTTILLRKVNGTIEIISKFSVNTNDFNIKIPTILSMKIAETVNIESVFLVK